jgi:hypothetical protein
MKRFSAALGFLAVLLLASAPGARAQGVFCQEVVSADPSCVVVICSDFSGQAAGVIRDCENFCGCGPDALCVVTCDSSGCDPNCVP